MSVDLYAGSPFNLIHVAVPCPSQDESSEEEPRPKKKVQNSHLGENQQPPDSLEQPLSSGR